MTSRLLILLLVTLSSLSDLTADSSDWPRFRGPNGSGINQDGQTLPQRWSVSENTKWKIDLPGPGHSSPIIVGDHIFITYWTEPDPKSSESVVKFHLLCLDRKGGKTVWDAEINPKLPLNEFRGVVGLHGHACHTPVSDGAKVFAFFGTTGVTAFDMSGKQLWQTDVGNQLEPRGLGSAASLILYQDKVIVTASIESTALIALAKETGEEVWKHESPDLANTWSTPALVTVGDRTDLVLSVPYKILGFDPETGELRWHCVGSQDTTAKSSVIVQDDVVYVLGGRGGGTVAVRAGGQGNVSETHCLWESGRIGVLTLPIHHDGRLHWVHNTTAYCLNSKTGEVIYRKRMAETKTRVRRSEATAAKTTDRSGSAYASPVVEGDRMYHLKRNGELIGILLGEEFKEFGRTTFESEGEFLATPAISRGQMFVRSTKHLYCIGKK